MFEGSCPDKGDIIVPDINPDIFKALLECIYSDKLEVALENISEALYVAEKYMVSTMKKECTSLLSSSAETSNAPVVFNIASHFHLESLKAKSLMHIQNNAVECLTAPNAMKISKENIEAILKLDSMSCSETNTCRFLIMWLSHQCEVQGKTASGENMREVIGSLLYLVRFPFVNKVYFAKEIAHSGLLTWEEVVSVFSSHYGRKNEFFTGSVRHSRVFNQHYTVLRHRNILRDWTPYTDVINYDALKIKVNKNIELKSVILYGPDGDVSSSDENLTVNILNNSGNEIFSQKYESCTERRELQTLNLSEPIELDSNKYFTIILVGLKFQAHYGTKCKPEYKIDDIIVTFHNSPNCNTTTKVEQGQIAGIEFNV
ncbi:BTB/POZ domain-containing protein 2-like isoform X2 [Mytilus californianus]|uniref:BTB/POZ domain-containing protein 2-like isoform X2 n=1 Tax=Mytilus californianus TaxID=6549 RepID=UPI002247EFA7|nr:BTB/POZ domain-containing protein 2-like isoform X2 [Mytilus californianus]